MARLSAPIYTDGYQLKHQIEQERHLLVELACRKGLQHGEVIYESQVLDDLLNDYYRNNP